MPKISVDSVVKALPAFSGVESGPLLARKEPLNDPPGPLCTRQTTGDSSVRRRRRSGISDVLLTFHVLDRRLLIAMIRRECFIGKWL